MADKESGRIINIVYIGLIVLALFMHMSVSGVDLGKLVVGIFTSLDGILVFITSIFFWLIDFIFRVHTIFMFGTLLMLWFVLLPMLVRYRFIKVNVNFSVSLICTLYIFLLLRIYGVLPA
ncbi:MAG: hypothetical protein LAT67_00250 [Balneolales bacterium]|nr:hypothetical protein [Balneolales bacterium]